MRRRCTLKAEKTNCEERALWLNYVLTFLTCCLRVLKSKNLLGAFYQMEDEMLLSEWLKKVKWLMLKM